ncbi:MAG: cysteine synthase A [Candidatus Krumholzibacteria bacterium]|nr:cysteine synthase A [Candidatus Krumholzibacteria bacterium]
MKRDLIDAIGNTPLVPLKRITEGCYAKLAAKLEGFNPGGSIKDRVALFMVEGAESDGLLVPGGRIIEPTSGNTGIGLALVASVKGYSLTVTMPDSMSVERRRILASYGAEVVLTPAEDGMKGAIAKAETLVLERENAFMPMQFDNPANPEAHRQTTGREIWEATYGSVDGVICGVGTGGTITGIGKSLKSAKKDITMIAVEPMESAVLSGGTPGPHSIEGIGAGFVPGVLDRDVIDEVIAVGGDEAREMTRRLAREEGIFAGISSGAALAAALKTARRKENEGKLFVVVFPDRGEKYLSTGLWS